MNPEDHDCPVQSPRTRSSRLGNARLAHHHSRNTHPKIAHSSSSSPSCIPWPAPIVSQGPDRLPVCTGFKMTPPSLVVNTSPSSNHTATSPGRTSSWLSLSQSSLSTSPGKNPLGPFSNVSPSFSSPRKSLDEAITDKSTFHGSLRNGHTAGFMFGTGHSFSSTSQPSRSLDVVEAMEIDSQEEEEEGARGNSNPKITAPKTAIPSSVPVTTTSASTFKPREKLCLGPKTGKKSTPKATTADQSLVEEAKKPEEQTGKQSLPRRGAGAKKTDTNKKNPIYIVLHVSRVQVGELLGKATAPVKIFAEKILIEMESEGTSENFSFRIPCKDLSHCKVCLLEDPLVFAVRPTAAGAQLLTDKRKKKAKYIDPENKDLCKRDVILHLNYKTIPEGVKGDLVELNRFSGQLEWQQMSSEEMKCYLGGEGQAGSSMPPEEKPSAVTSRKILTPKGKRWTKKSVPAEAVQRPPEGETPESLTPNTKDETPKTKDEENLTKTTETTQEPRPQVRTRSRTRKAPSEAENEPSDTEAHTTKPKVALLHRHQEMETHISLLDQHSREQRVNLERLLQEERAMKDRNLGRIQELERALQGKEELISRQETGLVSLSRELEQLAVSARQLQNELDQERETASRLRKLQTDLTQTRRALDEEKVVRAMREQQLSDKDSALAELRTRLTEQQQIGAQLEEDARQARAAEQQHEDALRSEQTSREDQTRQLRQKESELRRQERLQEEGAAAQAALERSVRRLQTELGDERNSRQSAEDELRRERTRLHDERTTLERERDEYETRLREERTTLERERAECETRLREERTTLERERAEYEARLRENQRATSDSERRLQDLQSAVAAAQGALDEYRRLEPRDWIIRREEVTLADVTLGVGAWGSVTKGTFRGCAVAVKRIHELILSPHNRRLFEREMSIASRCRHPCLLQFIGATNDDNDSPLFVTEMLDTDLRAVLSRRALHQEEILAIASDVARALNYLHLSKPEPIMHRDISSSNVLLWRRDDCWRAKLSDYGAANFMRQLMTVHPGARIYAAPEALTSQQSPKVDVYSFGLLLCEMCVRELPVPQQIHDQIGLVTNSVLRELIMRCVRTEPEARPTMAEVITILERRAENLRSQDVVAVNGRLAAV